MNPVDKIMAQAQIALVILFTVGIFAIVFVLLFFSEHLTSTATTILTSVITALVTILTLMANFFFARQRQSGLPDATNTVTQTHTTPDGSRTVITSPATATVLAPLSTASEIPK